MAQYTGLDDLFSPWRPVRATFALSPTARIVDTQALRRISARMQAAAEPPWLHQEVARRMAERLPIILLQPGRVLDWWCHTPLADSPLRQAYPKAVLTALQPDSSRVEPQTSTELQHLAGHDVVRVDRQAVQQAPPAAVPAPPPPAPWWSLQRWRAPPPLALNETQLAPGGADLLWANMATHHLADPERTFQAWYRALAVQGFVMFSTVGPGTLTALQALYKGAGWAPPFAPFVDMHDLGDMLVAAGFVDPVMDQELLSLTWPTPAAALAELRQLGGNAHPLRAPGLRTPAWRRRLLDLLRETQGADGRVALGFEVVYGHAFKPQPRARVAATTHIAVDELQRMARAHKDTR